MIDEELYRKAADELNSEHRRPHIWARACALANDDHDEARYLYTNLRVEELLAAQADGGASGSGRDVDGEDDIPLELEPVAPADPAPLDTDPGDDRQIVSMPAGSDARSVPLPPGAFDEGTLRPASEHGRVVLDLDEGATLDLNPADVAEVDEASRAGAPADPERRSADGDAVGETPDEKASDALAIEDDGGDASDVPLLSNAPGEVEDPFRSETGDGGGRAVATIDPAHDPADDPVDDSGRVGMEADVLAAPTSPSSGALDDLDWLDEAYREERRTLSTPPAVSGDAAGDAADDELTRELRRQAEELPGGRGSASVIAYDEASPAIAAPGEDESGTGGGPGADPSTTSRADRGDDDAREASGLGVVGAALSTSPDASLVTGDAVPETAPPPRSDDPARAPDPAPDSAPGPMPDPADDFAFGATVGATSPARDGEPLELVDEGADDEEYAVFARDGKRWQAVRQGNSWWAMLLTLPWLLYRHLVGTAALYALLAATVLVGLAVTGFAWHDAGADAPLVTQAAAIGFAVLAFVGLFVVPFRSANHWREDKLERRGFELVAYVRARGASRALELARRATSGTS